MPLIHLFLYWLFCLFSKRVVFKSSTCWQKGRNDDNKKRRKAWQLIFLVVCASGGFKVWVGGVRGVGDGGGATYVFCRTVQRVCARHPENIEKGEELEQTDSSHQWHDILQSVYYCLQSTTSPPLPFLIPPPLNPSPSSRHLRLCISLVQCYCHPSRTRHKGFYFKGIPATVLQS